MTTQNTANLQSLRPYSNPGLKARKRIFAIALSLVVIACMIPRKALAASNEQDSRGSEGRRGCSLATLQGRYLFAESGILLPPAFGVTAPTPGGDAGFRSFNGDGTGTDTVTVRIGANVFLENAVSPFVYTVNANCTGTITVLNGPTFGIFVAPDGEEFASIATAPAGNFPTTIVRRVSRR